jgi:glycosyltransferase involved in cell wall biosynthesis
VSGNPAARFARRVRARAAHVSVEGELERLKDLIESREERRLLAEARAGRDVCWTDEGEAEPLVTVRIATYNRADLLVERSLASALRQTYDRLEILVVGDHTDAATDKAMAAVKDPRVRYVNLPDRGRYPQDPALRWMVAGSAPMNAGLTLATGSWIAPCDDDDEFTDDHVEVLLHEARRRRLEMVYGAADMEQADGTWQRVGEWPLRAGGISHGATLYSLGLRFLRYSQTCFKTPEPFDWNLWRRMDRLGVRTGYLDRVVFTHYETPHD